MHYLSEPRNDEFLAHELDLLGSPFDEQLSGVSLFVTKLAGVH